MHEWVCSLELPARHLLFCSPYILRQGLSLTPKLSNWAILTGQQAFPVLHMLASLPPPSLKKHLLIQCEHNYLYLASSQSCSEGYICSPVLALLEKGHTVRPASQSCCENTKTMKIERKKCFIHYQLHKATVIEMVVDYIAYLKSQKSDLCSRSFKI